MDNNFSSHFEAPMPWIGMYIAGASAVCTIAMASNLVMGIISKKFWFPSKYFSLNATLLTLLAVATKLNTDISNTKIAVNDAHADLSSLVLMSTTIVNFMTSLATMDDNEILLNLTALSILAITIVVDVFIFNIELFILTKSIIGTIEVLLVVTFLFLLVILLFASAVVIPITRRSIESDFRLKQSTFSSDDERVENGQVSTDDLRTDLNKYWVMARTGNPEFVMARSVICVLPAFICLLMSLILFELHIQLDVIYNVEVEQKSSIFRSESSYRWSINWIMWIQTGGVAIGIIAPLSRCYICAEIWHGSLKDQLKVETYWTRRLAEWRESPLPIRIRHQKRHVFLQNSKIFLINFCIRIQLLIVRASKQLLFLPMLFFRFFHQIKKPISHDSSSSRDGEASEFGQYVLLLEGEPQLPYKMIAAICNEFDKLINVGERQKLTHLAELLQLSETFDGVREFCNDNSLPNEQLRNCWSLSVVTLTCIAGALPLPNAMEDRVHQLITAVSEGLLLVKHIEELYETDHEAVRMRKVASTVWNKLQMYHKWLGKDIKDKTPEMLSCIANDILNHPEESTKDSLDWQTRDIAANSMRMICETLVLGWQTDHGEMFENLSRIISDILAACLTNLPRAIITMSQNNAPEESVKQAAILLGKTEEIIQNLEHRNKPSLKPEEKGNMDSWRAIFKQESGKSNQPCFSH